MIPAWCLVGAADLPKNRKVIGAVGLRGESPWSPWRWKPIRFCHPRRDHSVPPVCADHL